MSIFFAFSDESGGYKTERTGKYLTKNPYYVRATYIMKGEEWKKLNNEFLSLKDKYKLSRDKEVKWAYMWSLYSYLKHNKPVPDDKPFYFLSKYSYPDLINFIDESLSLLNTLSYVSVIITVTDNEDIVKIAEHNLFKMHIQEIMQRVEMEIQTGGGEHLCILFIDPISQQEDSFFKDVYYELFCQGDFIKQYSHIKDSLVVENSHQSVGIQLADYIAGSFLGLLKGYKRSTDIFYKNIRKKLRNKDDDIWGYGIREIPRSDEVRMRLKEKVE